MSNTSPIRIERDRHVATIFFSRPPNNFVDVALLRDLQEALHALDIDEGCRCVVLASDGKNFCAGADFSGSTGQDQSGAPDAAVLYEQAMRLFETRKPIVAAVQGSAIGAGAGLALVADFRVASPESRFAFNFNRLGFHPGFGLSHTLPRLVGVQKAAELFYVGRRIGGDEAAAIGLVDELVQADTLLARAQALAADIAASAPAAVESTRLTLRAGLAATVREINQRELAEQWVHFASADFREGVRAMAERRLPEFGRR